MKIYILTIAFLLTLVGANAQTKLLKPLNRINLGVFTTEINYSREIPIADRSTIEGTLGMSLFFYDNDFAVQLRPELSVDYKFYYNVDRRNRKGKNINGNSASFFGASALSYLFPLNKLEQSRNKNFVFGGAVFWGIRQQINESGFQVNFLAGPGLSTKGHTSSDSNFFIHVKTGISYLF